MTQEEKAKAYDEALEQAKRWHKAFVMGHNYPATDIKVSYEIMFPELKESEDERIRKELIAFLKYYHTGQGNCVVYDDDWIAWLEKQGEQKPAWSEEDEKIYQSIMDDTVQENQLDIKQINWLKSLRQRIKV